MTTDLSVPAAYPLVVQHNALVNARFDLNTTESRLFLAMLARIKRDDTTFVMRVKRTRNPRPGFQPELRPRAQGAGKICQPAHYH
jgi:hypothetical protein